MRDIYQWKISNEGLLNLPRPSTTTNRLVAIGKSSLTTLEKRFIEIYCPIRNEWKIVSGLKNERDGCCSVFLGCELFNLGGANFGTNETSQLVSRVNKS